MDASRFDALTRSLTEPGTRRRLIGALAAGVLGVVGLAGAEARTCTGHGTICREDATCCSGLCGPKDRTGRRRCACQAHADCPPTAYCQDGACRPRVPLGASCAASAECLTTVCACQRLDCDGGGTCAHPNFATCSLPWTVATPEGPAEICSRHTGGPLDCAAASCGGGWACRADGAYCIPIGQPR